MCGRNEHERICGVCKFYILFLRQLHIFSAKNLRKEFACNRRQKPFVKRKRRNAHELVCGGRKLIIVLKTLNSSIFS